MDIEVRKNKDIKRGIFLNLKILIEIIEFGIGTFNGLILLFHE